ncbi:MAG: hypothetical protein B7C55_07825 [Actinomycetales bacterium mxb001]|nr:MAG: hypothetical protein B7C55_07825 [Actinomycetales bacterium mxb001]
MEFTGILKLEIEVAIKAKNKKEALSFFGDLHANITIENDGNRDIQIGYDNLHLIENDWELVE